MYEVWDCLCRPSQPEARPAIKIYLPELYREAEGPAFNLYRGLRAPSGCQCNTREAQTPPAQFICKAWSLRLHGPAQAKKASQTNRLPGQTHMLSGPSNSAHTSSLIAQHQNQQGNDTTTEEAESGAVVPSQILRDQLQEERQQQHAERAAIKRALRKQLKEYELHHTVSKCCQ